MDSHINISSLSFFILPVQNSRSSEPPLVSANEKEVEAGRVQDAVAGSSGTKQAPNNITKHNDPSKKNRNPSKDKSSKLWTAEQELKFLSSSFDAPDAFPLHSYYKCKNRMCNALSSVEASRLNEQSVDRFQHQWIMDDDLTYSSNTGVNWLIYQEGWGMFCLLCRKHGTTNYQNKSKKYNVEPAIRFKRKAVEDHASSQQHAAAVTAELLSRVSTFEEEVRKIEGSKDEVYYKTLLAMYWIAKEEIPNKKFTSLLALLQQLGLEDIKYFKHRSAGSTREMFLLIGGVLKTQLVDDISKAKCFGLLTDEVCDVSNKEQLVTFVKFVHPETGKAKTAFLAASNLLENSSSANAKTITDAIVAQVEDAGIDKRKLTSFSTDGASVMTGKRNGVAARLRADNKALINIHCICHRLALACGDANDRISYIKVVEKVLLQLWSFFENSAKKNASYAKAVLTIKQLSVSNRGQKKLRKRFQKACRSRWLSTEKAIEGIYEDYEALVQTLRVFKESGDATATGLLQQTSNLKFLGTVYLLHEVLPILGHLSKTFQEGEVCLASIAPAIEYTADRLDDVCHQHKHLARLKEDLTDNGRLQRCDLPSLTPHMEEQLKSLTTRYLDALKENIENRFDGNLKVLTAFKVFDPTAVPEKNEVGFKQYGIADVGLLGDFFYQDWEDKDLKKEELLCEWAKFKYNLLGLRSQLPPEIAHPNGSKTLCKSKTPSEWLLEHMLSMQSTYQHLCPCLLELAEVCLSLPVSNAWPERGASCIKRLKTRLRSSLKNDMLQALMHIAINGPSTSQCHSLIHEVAKQWLAKPRRNLAKIPAKGQQPTQIPTTADASVQVDTQREDVVRAWEAVAASVKNIDSIIDQEVEEAVAYLKLPPIDVIMSEAESECSESEDSDDEGTV